MTDLTAAIPSESEPAMQTHETDLGRATSAILASLLKTLTDKKLLSNADVRVLLARAVERLGPHDYGAPAGGAAGIILDLLESFPEDGGD